MDLKKVVFIWKHLVSWSQIGGSFLELKFWEEGNECKRAPFSATSPNGRACPRCLFFDFSQHFTLEKYQKNPHFLILEFRDQLTEYENNFFLSLCNFNVQGSHNQFCKRLCSTHTGLISWNCPKCESGTTSLRYIERKCMWLFKDLVWFFIYKIYTVVQVNQATPLLIQNTAKV